MNRKRNTTSGLNPETTPEADAGDPAVQPAPDNAGEDPSQDAGLSPAPDPQDPSDNSPEAETQDHSEDLPEDSPEDSPENSPADAPEDASDDSQSRLPAGSTSGEPDIKIVLSISEGSAHIGAQKPAADPVIESFDTLDIDVLVQQLPDFLERAQNQWAESLMYPKHVKPSQPRRTRRTQTQQQPANPPAPATPPTPPAPTPPRARTLSMFDE